MKKILHQFSKHVPRAFSIFLYFSQFFAIFTGMKMTFQEDRTFFSHIIQKSSKYNTYMYLSQCVVPK